MTLRMYGATSGFVDIDVPAIAGSASVVIPADAGILATQSYVSTTANITASAIAGLQLITNQSFSAASSVNVNNCFSSTYDNYLIIGFIQESQNCTVQFRLRAAGVDASGASTYYFVGGLNASPNSFGDISRQAPGPGSLIWNMFSPAIATPTRWARIGVNGTTSLAFPNIGGYHTASTAYDGFTVFPDGGTLTGNLRVYGYRN